MRIVAIVLAGLVALAGLSWACVAREAPKIESELHSSVATALRALDASWASVAIDGRDLTLTGEAPNESARQQALAMANYLQGVRIVHDQVVLISASTDLAGTKDTGTIEPAEVSPSPKPIKTKPIKTKPTEARPEVPPVAKPTPAAPTEAAETSPGNVDSAASCQREIDTLLANERIHFMAASAAIESASYPLLDALAEALRDCPKATVHIGGHTDSEGTSHFNEMLSATRAEAVRNYLIRKRISPNRLVAQGFGSQQPIADNTTDEGRSQNRRIEFMIHRETP